MRIVAKLGYQPDQERQRSFKRLRAGTRMISFLVDPEVHNRIAHIDGFFSRHLHLIQRTLTNHHCYLMLTDYQRDVNESGELCCVVDGLVDGIIAEVVGENAICSIAGRVPIVGFNCQLNLPRVDSVMPNVQGAARQQVHHLRELGHESIACFRPRPGGWQDRPFWAVYQDTAEELGVRIHPGFLEPIHFGEDGHSQAIRAFLDRVLNCDQPPTAILTYDIYAVELIHQLSGRGLRVPQDISLVGFDDFTLGPCSPVPLTTFRQNFERMAQTAVQLLLERIQNPRQPGRLVQVEGDLVMRESTAAVQSTRGSSSPSPQPQSDQRTNPEGGGMNSNCQTYPVVGEDLGANECHIQRSRT